MTFTNPAVTDFKSQFTRDFPYGTDINTTILDSDITSAFLSTNVNCSPALQSMVADQGSYTLIYNLFAAHYLVINIRSSSQGINGQYNFLQNSKGVGQVNEAFSIPPRVTENTYWEQFYKTNYGASAMALILPQLGGNIFTVYGTTRA